MNPKSPFVILAALNVAGNTILGILAKQHVLLAYLIVPFLGIFFSQLCLLGFGFVVSTLDRPTRLAGLFAGIACLCLQFSYCLDEWELELLLLLLPPPLMVVGVLSLRAQILENLKTTGELDEAKRALGVQYSIRHLLIITLLASITLALGKWFLPSLVRRAENVNFLILGGYHALVCVAAIRIVFGRCNFIMRSGFGLLTACLFYFLPIGFDRTEHLFWAFVFIAHFASTLLLLALVHLCDYRLDHRLKLIRTDS